MILQCPNCDTRYDIEMDIPAGRQVRCAKCANVWVPIPLAADGMDDLAPQGDVAADDGASVAAEADFEQPESATSAVAFDGVADGQGDEADPDADLAFEPAFEDEPDASTHDAAGAVFEDESVDDDDAGSAVAAFEADPVDEADTSLVDPDLTPGASDIDGSDAETWPGKPANDGFSNEFFSQNRGSVSENDSDGFGHPTVSDQPRAGEVASWDDAESMLSAREENGDDQPDETGFDRSPASAAARVAASDAARRGRNLGRAFVIGLATLTAIAIGAGSAFAVFASETVMTYLPGTRALYERVGMVEPRGPEFEIRDVKARWDIADGKAVLKISGHVEAVGGDATADAPPGLVFALKGKNGDVLFTWASRNPIARSASGRFAFTETIPEPPNDVARIRVRFGAAPAG